MNISVYIQFLFIFLIYTTIIFLFISVMQLFHLNNYHYIMT